MKNKLRDYKFWTSTVSLIILILNFIKPEIDFGKYQPLFYAILGYFIQNGILHDYGTTKEGNGNVNN